MVGAELPMTSDQVIWSEQNRLHIAYDNCTFVSATGIITLNITGAVAGVNKRYFCKCYCCSNGSTSETKLKALVTASTPGAAPGTITAIHLCC